MNAPFVHDIARLFGEVFCYCEKNLAIQIHLNNTSKHLQHSRNAKF